MSIFDTPKPQLSPDIWMVNGVLRPDVKKSIFDILADIYPLNKVSALTLLGSLVGHQYTDTSDLDVRVMGIKDEDYDVWHTIFHDSNNKHFLPGTNHPVNFMFQEYNPGTEWTGSLGAYDILQDVWIKKPIPFDKIGDPYVKYEREIGYAKTLVSMIESEFLSIIECNKRGESEEVVRRLKNLAILFKTIEDNRKTAYRYSVGTPALQECNIIYKYLEDSPYAHLVHPLIDLYDKQWRFQEKLAEENSTNFLRKLKDDARYGLYILRHKKNIASPMLQEGLPLTQALKHDISKLTPTEFGPYRDWFFGPHGRTGNREHKTYSTWRKAVEHHYKRNPHHLYRLGVPSEKIPLKYKLESVADWYAVGKTKSALPYPSFKNWYKVRREHLPIDDPTRQALDKNLAIIKGK